MDVSELKVTITMNVDEDKIRAIVNSELEKAMDNITEKVGQHLIENIKIGAVS